MLLNKMWEPQFLSIKTFNSFWDATVCPHQLGGDGYDNFQFLLGCYGIGVYPAINAKQYAFNSFWDATDV